MGQISWPADNRSVDITGIGYRLLDKNIHAGFDKNNGIDQIFR